MRQVLSVSLPAQTVKAVKIISKKRGYASVSEYIKKLLEYDNDLISADDLLNDIKSARLEYKQGKTIVAQSLADLL